MGWKETQNNGNAPRDPWGKRHQESGDGPPDLDQILGNIQRGLGRMFGGKDGGGASGGGERGGMSGLWGLPPLLIAIAALGLLLYSMLYVVDQQERGVVLRFGKHAATLQPGLSVRMPPPIERVYKVNVGRISTVTHRALMLTQDENIVSLEVVAQYRIGIPENYLFNVVDPQLTLQQATESAVRSVIGKSQMDLVMIEGRSQIETDQLTLIQQIVDDYEAGLLVVGVEMRDVAPPDQVQSAFEDAVNAREDQRRLINEAEAYRNDILPRARGAAARVLEDANAYKASTIARAKGDGERFSQLLAEYQQAPAVTRQRLYLDTVESVLSASNKVLLDSGEDGASNKLIYLPVDRLLQQGAGDRRSDGSGAEAAPARQSALPNANTRRPTR